MEFLRHPFKHFLFLWLSVLWGLTYVQIRILYVFTQLLNILFCLSLFPPWVSVWSTSTDIFLKSIVRFSWDVLIPLMNLSEKIFLHGLYIIYFWYFNWFFLKISIPWLKVPILFFILSAFSIKFFHLFIIVILNSLLDSSNIWVIFKMCWWCLCLL